MMDWVGSVGESLAVVANVTNISSSCLPDYRRDGQIRRIGTDFATIGTYNRHTTEAFQSFRILQYRQDFTQSVILLGDRSKMKV